MTQAHVNSQTPLKDILRYYNDLTVRGFNGEVVVNALEILNQALIARGHRARVMGDYSINELDNSWRMQKLIDDIKNRLKED